METLGPSDSVARVPSAFLKGPVPEDVASADGSELPASKISKESSSEKPCPWIGNLLENPCGSCVEHLVLSVRVKN